MTFDITSAERAQNKPTMMGVSRLRSLHRVPHRLFHGSSTAFSQRLNGIPSVLEDNTEAEAEFLKGEVSDSFGAR
jgi:hypothetical protein